MCRLFQVGRLSSAEARKKDPKQTHATYTALWPLFTQVNSQVEDYSDEEEAGNRLFHFIQVLLWYPPLFFGAFGSAPMRSKKLSKRQQQREQEEDDEVAIFENLISTISLILNIRVNAVSDHYHQVLSAFQQYASAKFSENSYLPMCPRRLHKQRRDRWPV